MLSGRPWYLHACTAVATVLQYKSVKRSEVYIHRYKPLVWMHGCGEHPHSIHSIRKSQTLESYHPFLVLLWTALLQPKLYNIIDTQLLCMLGHGDRPQEEVNGQCTELMMKRWQPVIFALCHGWFCANLVPRLSQGCMRKEYMGLCCLRHNTVVIVLVCL